MVQSCRMDPYGDGPLLCPDSRLWGSSGFGSGPVLEALRMASVPSATSAVSGHFIHGAVPHQPPAAPSPATGPLLRLFLVEAFPGASNGHDAGSWPYLPFHPQKEAVTGASVSGWKPLFKRDTVFISWALLWLNFLPFCPSLGPGATCLCLTSKAFGHEVTGIYNLNEL